MFKKWTVEFITDDELHEEDLTDDILEALFKYHGVDNLSITEEDYEKSNS